jgi:hypothetical protein
MMSNTREESEVTEEQPDLTPNLDFLLTEVSDEDVKNINNSQWEVTKFLLTEFWNGLQFCVEFLHNEDQITHDGVTEGMRSTMTDVQNWHNLLDNTSHLWNQVIEAQLEHGVNLMDLNPPIWTTSPEIAPRVRSGSGPSSTTWSSDPRTSLQMNSRLAEPCPSSRRDVSMDLHRRPMTTGSHMTTSGNRLPGINS